MSKASNLNRLIHAVMKDKTKGETSLTHLLATGQLLKVVHISEKDLRTFRERAEDKKILFAALHQRDSDSTVCDIIVPAKYLTATNQILHGMEYAPPVKQEQETAQAKNAQPRALSMMNSKERGNTSPQPQTMQTFSKTKGKGGLSP